MNLSLDWSVLPAALPFLLQGMGFSIALLAVSLLGGLVLGTGLALMRLSSNVLVSSFAAAYVSIFRSIPLVLAIFWCYLLVPMVVEAVRGVHTPIGPMYSAFIAYVLFEAAYFCEVIRAGILSVRRDQTSASLALGLTRAQTMRYVILPQAVRTMMPLILTKSIIIFQDTSLVYVISVSDFLGAATRIGQRDSRLIELYLFAGAVYFILCFAASKFVEARTHRKVAT
ncbi:ABC transporter permease subunit [Rhodanobacter sp. KK11]|jgi:glutamate/aspartate transport system permease protein|uniref:ABC transporter permease subunit n=1 Tax=Rhodanobacter sp. KK11 TaxID=3083255 RepID=UPI002966EE33|nr:ABC transporter permease subunit [Rhodanobacter sp. KK11]MDW2980508.1 ABC transporter permease subunit [Rhodanobacter sp. KK11]